MKINMVNEKMASRLTWLVPFWDKNPEMYLYITKMLHREAEGIPSA